MKKFIFGLVLLVCVAGAAPLVSGFKAERELDHWVNYINESGTYDASWDYYNKGWLDTDAVLLIKLKTPINLPSGTALTKDWILPLHIVMNHGPLLVKDNFRQGWFSGRVFLSKEHEGWIKDHVQVEGEGPFYSANLYMDLRGDLHINDYSLPFSITDEGDTFRVDGYSGNGILTLNKSVDYSGVLPSITLTGEKGKFNFEKLSFTLSSNLSEKFGDYLAPGKGVMSLESLTADLPDELQFTLNNAYLSSEMIFNDGQKDANIAIEVGFKKFLSESDQVEDAKFVMAFEHLSLTFLDKYLGMIQQFGSIGAENASLMAMQMSALAASELLPSGPKLSISDFHFSTVDGKLTFSGDVAIAAEAAAKMSNPLSMISDITMNASLEVDKALAQRLTKKSTLREINNHLLESGESMSDEEKNQMADQQASMQLSMLVVQGMLAENEPKYNSDFHFKAGVATLNGQVVPLPF